MPPATTPRRWLVEFRRSLRRHRRKLAVLATLAAVLCGLTALAPPRPATVAVVTAARTLPGGAVLAAADLGLTELPPDAVPEGSWTDPAEAVGKVLAGPVPTGQVLTRTALLRYRAAGGRVVAPLRLADARVSALVEAGDAVDVLAADQQTGKSAVVAANVRVVSAVAGEDADPGAGGLVLVEVDSEIANALAAAAATAVLSIVWR